MERFTESSARSHGDSADRRGSFTTRGGGGSVENRRIVIRELKYGQSRYLTSDAFERDILTKETLVERYIENKVPNVMTTFIPPKERWAFASLCSFQIFHWKHPFVKPRACIARDTKVYLHSDSRHDKPRRTVNSDYAFAMVILDEDTCYLCHEHILDPLDASRIKSVDVMSTSKNTDESKTVQNMATRPSDSRTNGLAETIPTMASSSISLSSSSSSKNQHVDLEAERAALDDSFDIFSSPKFMPMVPHTTDGGFDSDWVSQLVDGFGSTEDHVV